MISPLVEVPNHHQGDLLQDSGMPDSYNRHQSVLLGDPSPVTDGAGLVEPGGPDSQYKLVRAKSSPPGSTSVPLYGGWQTHSCLNRQHSSQGPHKLAGRDQVQVPDAGGQMTGALGREESVVDYCGAHLRGSKCAGRLAQPSSCGQRRVAPASIDLPGDCGPLRPPGGQLIRHPSQHIAPTVLPKVPFALGRGSGRPPLQLASRPSLWLPPSADSAEGHLEDHKGGGRGRADRPTLASQTLVRRTSVSVDRLWKIPRGRISLSQGSLEHPNLHWFQLTAWHLSRAS